MIISNVICCYQYCFKFISVVRFSLFHGIWSVIIISHYCFYSFSCHYWNYSDLVLITMLHVFIIVISDLGAAFVWRRRAGRDTHRDRLGLHGLPSARILPYPQHPAITGVLRRWKYRSCLLGISHRARQAHT